MERWRDVYRVSGGPPPLAVATSRELAARSAATAVHRLLMMGVIALVEQHWSGTTWGAMLTEIALNTAAGYIVFQIVGALPGVMERQRLSRRASFGRRQW